MLIIYNALAIRFLSQQLSECRTYRIVALHRDAAPLPMLLHRHQLLAQLLGERNFRVLGRAG